MGTCMQVGVTADCDDRSIVSQDGQQAGDRIVHYCRLGIGWYITACWG